MNLEIDDLSPFLSFVASPQPFPPPSTHSCFLSLMETGLSSELGVKKI